MTKEGHEKLCKLGLLKNEGGLCQKCDVQLRLIKHKRKDGLMWKCTKCKVTTKSIRQNSIFHNSKITIYQIIVLIFQFTKKGSTKNTSALVGISNRTAAEWSKYMRNVCTRILLKLDMTMGGRNKRRN